MITDHMKAGFEFGAASRESRPQRSLMSVTRADDAFPRRSVLVVLVLFVASFAYSAVVRGSLIEWYVVWGGAFSVALVTFTLYLFYRLVVALELIAERL
jgi:hypothetical protein